MGVDAEMAVRVYKELSDREIKRLAYELSDCFGGYVTVWRKANGVSDNDEHCVSRQDEYYTLTPEKGETLLKISTMCRYYGVGYERGPLMQFINIAEWFEAKYPTCVVYYGGDSGDTLSVFDNVMRDVLFKHFVENGRRPYQGAFRSIHDTATPLCSLCDERMNNHGGGRGKEFYACPCGEKVITEIRTGTVLERWFDDVDFFVKADELEKQAK